MLSDGNYHMQRIFSLIPQNGYGTMPVERAKKLALFPQLMTTTSTCHVDDVGKPAKWREAKKKDFNVAAFYIRCTKIYLKKFIATPNRQPTSSLGFA